MMIVDRLDHFTLPVSDVDAAVAFYQRVLGLSAMTLADGRRALLCGTQMLCLQASTSAAPVDVGFVTRTPIADVLAHLAACGIALPDGPVRRDGAVGPLEAITIRDPDGNRLQIANQIEAVA